MADEQLAVSPDERAGGYISKIQFNTGEEISFKKDDIVIFVGPNNAGKSQALRDIYSLSENNNDGIVIKDLSIYKYKGDIVQLLNKLSSCEKDGSCIRYNILNTCYTVYDGFYNSFCENDKFYDFRNLFVLNINTEERLKICRPIKIIKRNEEKIHPIHYAAFNGDVRKKLSDKFKKAFGKDLIPNTGYGSVIPLCIGDPVILQGEYKDEQERREVYDFILEKYKQVQDQGDGIKSFTGILLYLILDYFCIYLIDEPESFLHPPQARIMGEVIGETLSHQQQAFISTHSEEIIKGLLDVCPDRIKIIRITREGDENSFSVLDNEKIRGIWNDPLLKYSNIMSSLFHKTVVLCESDSDCKMYSLIDNYLKQKEGKYSETLFIHCGGKQRISKIARALRALNIDVRIIADIDILNNENVFRECIESCNIQWCDILNQYKTIVSSLYNQKNDLKRGEIKELINNIIDNSSEKILSNDEIKEIQKLLKIPSKWDGIKENGISAIPKGDATKRFNEMNAVLHQNGIYLVPVGELENFIREVGDHGPQWGNKVLEQYPDFDDDVYKEIRDFISSLNM